jgi:hypothetical protein
MAGDLLLVGSIPLDTPEQVFRRVGGPLGPYLAFMPDGEIGDRRYWIDGIAYRVYNGHPEIETLRRPAPDANGVESWRPLGVHDQFQFRVKPGVTQVRFGDPGWRLGYTKDAVGSHFVFRQLQIVVEEIARADAAAAWNLMLGATSGLWAAFLPEHAAREIYGASDAVVAACGSTSGSGALAGGCARRSSSP